MMAVVLLLLSLQMHTVALTCMSFYVSRLFYEYGANSVLFLFISLFSRKYFLTGKGFAGVYGRVFPPLV